MPARPGGAHIMTGTKEVLLRGGPPVHPYVFSKRVYRMSNDVRDGDLVQLKTREGKPFGWGFAHRASLIAVRVLSWNADEVPDEDWLREKIRSAEHMRRDVLELPRHTNAWRMLHAEGDGVSGLVVDRYAETAAVSIYSLGWHRRFAEVERILREETGVTRVIPRVDQRTATHERFDVPAPAPGPVIEVEEHGVRFLVDPTGGHKTGFFLDQRDNRHFMAGLSRGKRVFDGMTYTGGFAIHAAKAGAASVRAMDLDEEAVAHAARNAEANGVDVTFAHDDVFNALRVYAGGPAEARPEVLIVDPPKWAKDRGGFGTAMRRYADLNRLALESVAPGGILCTSSCSGLVGEHDFLGMLRSVSLDTRRALRILRVAGAGPDHPLSANFPESRYLKCVVLQVGEPGSGPGAEARPEYGADRGRDDRGPRGRDDRGPRGGDDRGPRGRDDRGPRGRDDRGPRGRDDRGPRGRDDRGPRGRDDRGPRGRDDRGPRGRDDRGPRGRDDRGPRGRDDRGPRGRDDRGPRGRDDRGPRGRDDRGPRGRDDRGPRGRDDRGPRGRDDRGPRGRDDRGPRGGGSRGSFRDDRPKR